MPIDCEASTEIPVQQPRPRRQRPARTSVEIAGEQLLIQVSPEVACPHRRRGVDDLVAGNQEQVARHQGMPIGAAQYGVCTVGTVVSALGRPTTAPYSASTETKPARSSRH
jgi:hypothetical protein